VAKSSLYNLYKLAIQNTAEWFLML